MMFIILKKANINKNDNTVLLDVLNCLILKKLVDKQIGIYLYIHVLYTCIP